MTAQELVRWIQAACKESDTVFVEYDGQYQPLQLDNLSKEEVFGGPHWYEGLSYDDTKPKGLEPLGIQFVIKSRL